MKCLAQGASPGYSAATELEADLRRHLEFLPPKYARSFAPREHFRKWMARHPVIRSAGFISLAFSAVAAVIFSWVAFRIQRDAKRLAENRFVNATRELNDANGALASAGFGGASIKEAITKSKSLLNQFEIPESAPPAWEDKLPAISRAQLRRQLGEFHYLLASAHLQNLRGDSALADPARELELANQHHQLSVEMFEEQQPPKVLQWQSELLREPDHAGKAPEWQRFATWAKAEGHELTESAKWLDQRLLAIEHYRQGDFRSAAALLEAGLQDHATDYSSWLILGNAHAKARDFSKAEICYLVCQALRPKSADAYFNLGVARIDANLFREAIADFNRCIELNRTAPEYFANRGLCFFNMGDLKSAESDLTQALELGATETRLYFFRSQVRRALGNASGADEDQAVGLKSIPSDELSWISRGFYSVEENPQQAISDFQSAIRLNPRSANAWENCAAVYADKLQDLPKSIECMDELVRMEPKNPKHLASRGVLFARMGNRDSALADAQTALQLSNSGETLYRVGSVFARLAETHPDDAEQATRLIRAAASKDPLFVVRYLGKDQDLKPILERPEFQELSERLDWLKTQPKSQ